MGQALYLETFLRVSVLSKFPKKWVPGVIFHEEFEKNGVRLPKSKHPILVGIIIVCSLCLCLSQPLKSFEPALGFSRNLVSSVFRAFKPQIQIFKKIRVYLLPFAYVFL